MALTGITVLVLVWCHRSFETRHKKNRHILRLTFEICLYIALPLQCLLFCQPLNDTNAFSPSHS